MKYGIYISILIPLSYAFIFNSIIKYPLDNNVLNNNKKLIDIDYTNIINKNNSLIRKSNVNNLFNNTIIKKKTDWEEDEVPWDVNSIKPN